VVPVSLGITKKSNAINIIENYLHILLFYDEKSL